MYRDHVTGNCKCSKTATVTIDKEAIYQRVTGYGDLLTARNLDMTG